MEILTADLHSIPRNGNKTDWLPTVCCHLDKWRKCFEDGAAPFCDEDGVKFLRWGADANVGDLSDLACGAKLSWEGERCKGLQQSIDESPKAEPGYQPKSVLIPMFRIVSAFGADRSGPPQIRKFN